MLLLFDIDGTLLDGATNAHRVALESAIKEVHGVDPRDLRSKIGPAGLGKWFHSAPGGFGSDSEDRAALPSIARRRAGHVRREQTIVIGDTPRDIACARADGVRCVAVTTGQFGREDLSGAD